MNIFLIYLFILFQHSILLQKSYNKIKILFDFIGKSAENKKKYSVVSCRHIILVLNVDSESF